MNNVLAEKNVLLICPKFFNYHVEIRNALEKLGAKVDYFDERPSNTTIVKALLRVNKKFVYHRIKSYYDDILGRICDKKYDYILIIKPEAIPQKVIEKLRVMNPNAKIVIEIWDSIANNKEAEEKIRLADKAFSFDPRDCEKYNMNFRPLFYIEKYNEISMKHEKFKFDLLFVGTVHSDRYKILKNVEKKLSDEGYRVYYYMYIPSKALYFIRKILFKEFSKSRTYEFKFTPISQDDVASLVSKSKVIMDIQHPKQVGLTMRTIEMLGANRKIITTNTNVEEYDFYNKSNICVVDREMKNIDIDFLKSEYVPINDIVKEKYSIESWVKELLIW